MNRYGVTLSSLCVTSCLIAGCAVPNAYSTIRRRSNVDTDDYRDYTPIIYPTATVKMGFLKILSGLCEDARKQVPLSDRVSTKLQAGTGTVCEKKSPGTDFPCWAASYPKAKSCVDAVTKYTVDQCAILTGRQNVFASRFIEWLVPVEVAFGLGADIAAISTASSSSTAALTAVALTGAGDIQKSLPSVVSAKVADLAGSEQSYVLLANFNDEDVNYTSVKSLDPKSNGYDKINKSLLKFSELHDALLATCPANDP